MSRAVPSPPQNNDEVDGGREKPRNCGAGIVRACLSRRGCTTSTEAKPTACKASCPMLAAAVSHSIAGGFERQPTGARIHGGPRALAHWRSVRRRRAASAATPSGPLSPTRPPIPAIGLMTKPMRGIVLYVKAAGGKSYMPSPLRVSPAPRAMRHIRKGRFGGPHLAGSAVSVSIPPD